ncbi:MAG TPA: alpha/beta fold hydrolase [Anaerolineales bacterium]|nr:alpha/beta fold hydrolase [Anaerolineales bacterium]
MESRPFSLHHLVRFPEPGRDEQAAVRYPSVLALHGRGSNERDLIGLAPHLPDGLLWISPRAPLLLGPDSYEWYRVRVIGRPDPEQVMAALETIQNFIDEILATYPIDPQKLYLLGFSQGSILSICYTLNHPSRIAGVIAQSGYIPNGLDLEIGESEIKDKPFIMTHGGQDTMIPVDWARAGRDRLQALGVDLTYREFPMGHSISMDSLALISAWLKEQL